MTSITIIWDCLPRLFTSLAVHSFRLGNTIFRLECSWFLSTTSIGWLCFDWLENSLFRKKNSNFYVFFTLHNRWLKTHFWKIFHFSKSRGFSSNRTIHFRSQDHCWAMRGSTPFWGGGRGFQVISTKKQCYGQLPHTLRDIFYCSKENFETEFRFLGAWKNDIALIS